MPEPGPAVPRRGRPPKVSRERIIDAVLAEGFAGLTLSAVADRLGVTTMTLHRHAATRADLLAMSWDHVLDHTAWPEPDLPWRRLLRDYATTLWDLLARYPGAVTELSGTVLSPRTAVRLYDDLAVTLVEQGFDPADAVLAVDTVIDLAIDHRRGVENLARPLDGDVDATLQDQISRLWPTEEAGTGPRHEVRNAMSDAVGTPPREWFRRKLDLILDGLTTQQAGGSDTR